MAETKKKTDTADPAAEPVSTDADPAAEPVSTDAAPAAEPQECAACGETAVFTQHTVVGGKIELVYHACAEARKLVHDYFLATMNDPTATPPQLVK